MHGISLDMARAALILQDAGRPSHVPLAGQSWKDSPIMAQPALDHISVPSAELRTIADEVALLSARVSLLLDSAGVDLAPATVLPDNVRRLSDYRPRSACQAVQR